MLGRSQKLTAISAIAIAAMLTTAVPASSQGLFEALFGGFKRREAPPAASSYADPLTAIGDALAGRDSQIRSQSGPTVAYCVRTCDGAFFPMQRSAGNPAELCSAFAPATKTKVFSGGKIDGAVANDGTRYNDLPNAFAYRERVVDNCSWNGTSPYGVARIEPKADPTLRAGDIVATAKGLATYTGGKNRDTALAPVKDAKLAAIRVAPPPVSAAPVAAITPVRNDSSRSVASEFGLTTY